MAPTDSLDRRAFLRRGVQLGAWASGAVVAASVLEGCDHASGPAATSTSTSTSTSTTTLGPPTSTDWSSLGDALAGTLVLPTSHSYGVDRLLYNSKFLDLHPAALAYCASVDDVARCVDFATSRNLAFTARSGGHSYGGYSTSDGLVIDVSRLSRISVDTAANTASVGAGALLIDVYNTIGNADRLLPGGSCPTVGIAGLALGGGVGVFGRKYGLTADNLRSVSLVTADGHHLTASASDHADLWWASRGGGGGNFGVATSFVFGVHPMPEVTLFTLQFPWAAATDVLQAWQGWVATAPDELWSNCQLLAQGTYGYLAQVSGVYCGSSAALATLVSALERDIGVAASYSFNGSRPYLDAMEIEAGCSGLTVASCHLLSQNPDGRLSRSAYSAKSSYVDAAMTSPQATAIVAAVEHLHAVAPTLGGGLAFDAYGGAINRIASNETAFVHRDTLAGIQATYSWSTYTPASVVAAGQAWLTWLGAHVFDPASGAYQNYIDPTLANWANAYYGENLARLSKVKRTYDPDNHFVFAQSIPVGD